jgi:hypothetical protein
VLAFPEALGCEALCLSN